jgi:hypothetical protein
MEVLGLTIGAFPLIITAFHSYTRIRNFLSEYKQLDRHLQSVLRDIDTAQCLYTRAIDILLSEVIKDDIRDIMLHDMSNETWRETGLDEEICATLGNLGLWRPVENSIRGMTEVMKAIESILIGLDRSSDGTKANVAIRMVCDAFMVLLV